MKDNGTLEKQVGGRPLNTHWFRNDTDGLKVTLYWRDSSWSGAATPCAEISDDAMKLAAAELFYRNSGEIPGEIKALRDEIEEDLLVAVHGQDRSKRTILSQSEDGRLTLEMDYQESDRDVSGKITLTSPGSILVTPRIIVPTQKKSPSVLVDMLWPRVSSVQWVDAVIRAGGIDAWKKLAGDFLKKAGLPADYKVPEPLETN